MTGYDLRHHGDLEAAPGMLDFAVNVRLPAPPAWLRAVLVDSLDTLGRYPDPTSAAKAIAARHQRKPVEVLPTAGAAEAFTLLARALRPRRAICIHPSFTEPEAALRAAGHDVERVVLPAPYELRPAAIPEDADLVVVGNPTNPTGVLHLGETLRGLTRPDRVVVVDEAFMDTIPGERESLAAQPIPGLVVVRSLTKTWGLAGLRVGYVLAAPHLIQTLAAAQPHWPVSALALAALEACSTGAALEEAHEAAVETAEHRTYLVEGLTARGIPVVAGSQTSFVLIRLPDALGLHAGLRQAGVAVRRGGTFPGLSDEHLRIAVRTPAATDALLSAMDAAQGTAA